MDFSPDSPRYTVTARSPMPENLKEKISAALAQAVKKNAAQVQQHRDGGASNPPAKRSQDAA